MNLRRWTLPGILVVEIVVFTLLGGVQFRGPGDLAAYVASYTSDLLAQAAPVMLLAFGMTLVIMTAGIDLSVASMVALIAALMASCPGGAAFWWTALPLGLVAGLALGCTNGWLIARLDVPPIIATLGTMILYRGLCFVLLGDLEKAPFLDVPGYEWLGQIAGATVLLGIVYGLVGGWFQRARLRQELLTLGGNRVAARYAGVPVDRRIYQVYTAVGFLAFLSALTFTARNGSVSASSFSGVELQVIVAVVLGGTRVQGGSGSLVGSLLGALILAVLDEGLRGAAVWSDQHLPFKLSHLRYVLLGLLLAGGVWLNTRSTGLPDSSRKKRQGAVASNQ